MYSLLDSRGFADPDCQKILHLQKYPLAARSCSALLPSTFHRLPVIIYPLQAALLLQFLVRIIVYL